MFDQPSLEVCNVCKSFGGFQVIDNLCLELFPGERRVILGSNGAGKTTLFHVLSGLLVPDSGSIVLRGRDITRLSPAKRTLAGMSQSFQKNNLFTELTIGENLLLAAAAGQKQHLHLWRDAFQNTIVRATALDIAEQVGLGAYFNQPLHTAPYAHLRRLEIGISLATKPTILLLDEPTSGIGPEMVKSFHSLMMTLPQDLSILIIEHDMDFAFTLASTISVLHLGKIVFTGTPQQTKNHSLVQSIYLGETSIPDK